MDQLERKDVVVALIGAIGAKFYGNPRELADEVALMAGAIERRLRWDDVDRDIRLLTWTRGRLRALVEAKAPGSATRLAMVVAKELLEGPNLVGLMPAIDHLATLFEAHEAKHAGASLDVGQIDVVIRWFEEIQDSLGEFGKAI